MGNSHNSAGQLHSESRLAANKFDEDELHILRATWMDLAERNHGKGIDKDTFQQYFPLSGLLGDRLFAQFDVKGNGLIDLDEFVTGLSICSRGSFDEKIHFIFNMYDTSHDNTVSKEELTTLLNHIPKSFLGMNKMNKSAMSMLDENGEVVSQDDVSVHSGTSNHSGNKSVSPLGVHDHTSVVHDDEYEEDVDAYTNHDVVERAFAECDLNHEGRLKYEEFKMWVDRTPMIVEYFESILPFVGNKEQYGHTQKDALPSMQKTRSHSILGRVNSGHFEPVGRQRTTSISSLPRPVSSHAVNRANRTSSTENLLTRFHRTHDTGVEGGAGLTRVDSFGNGRRMSNGSAEMDNEEDSEEMVRQLLSQAMEITHNESLREQLQLIIDKEFGGIVDIPRLTTEDIYKDVVAKEGYLWKRGNMLHLWSKRWYLLSGNCMYYYAHKKDVRPRGVIFLTGCLVEKIQEEASELKGYYGIELLHQDLCTGEHYKHESRVLYCRSEGERDVWLNRMQHAAQVVPIEQEYVIGRELGRGRFSRVCECVHKVTGLRYAVKIIDKATIEPEEKSLLRTEIAVLKLVHHPNIIKLEGVFETRSHMYIVMEKLTGGELFERIVGRPRFSEEEAAKLIRPLLESVAYLHDLGIVHRDIKPENILCGDNLEELKIADFGLSKMLLPKEKMDTACGTLSYVAPEVLTMQGYGQEADLWSVGVIMFLVLCGKLPFDGNNHDEIIRCTIQAEMKVSPNTWNKLSDEAKSLIKALLHRNPKERISARAALRHPFIAKYFPSNRRSSMIGDNSSVGSQSLPPAIPAKSRNPSDQSVDSVNTSNVGLTIM